MAQAGMERPVKPYQARALDYLDITPGALPSVRALNRLIEAYLRKAPWESFSRIVKRHATRDTAQCPRWPEEFWAQARATGSGGTCYENNYAFFDLLGALGYEGYLTINDMGATRGCHAATIVKLEGCRYLVDVTIPIPCALPLPEGDLMRRWGLFHTYTIRRHNERYEIERSHHPKRNIYTLIDQPIADAEYRKIVEDDYGTQGLFLDRAVIVKAKGGQLWRFNSTEMPYRVEVFERGSRQEIALPVESLAPDLARCFELDVKLIAAALTILNIP